MIPIYRMPEIHIEITNGCNLECSNCTRHIGHHKKIFKMDLEMIRKVAGFPQGFPGTIGIMGGEPTTHPQFAEICKLFQKLIPEKHKRQLWTDGWGWEKYKAVIGETFDPDNIIYNSHQDTDVGTHQPLLVAAEDCVEDKELMWRLIGNCWVQ
ncbi:MAG: Radical SAM domain protein [Candidatus Giovannonibacteria bacterium GW2011_GWC2_43_8]|nr:MAG: Radical SAM domain protein [Candidatus Giovannonibacteria bacterium GW2011_GWC2_43_8]